MTIPAINQTASLALSAAKRAAGTSKDVSSNPSWIAPEKRSGGSTRMLIEKGLSAFSNHETMPSIVQDYVTQISGKAAHALPGSSGPVSDAVHRVVSLIPLVIASELSKISDHLVHRMMTSNGTLPTMEDNKTAVGMNTARGIDQPGAQAIQTATIKGNDSSTLEFP